MNHERIVTEHVSVTGIAGTHAEVVFFSVALAEYVVEHAQFANEPTTDEQAESDARGNLRVHRNGRQFHRPIDPLGIIRCRIVLAESRE